MITIVHKLFISFLHENENKESTYFLILQAVIIDCDFDNIIIHQNLKL